MLNSLTPNARRSLAFASLVCGLALAIPLGVRGQDASPRSPKQPAAGEPSGKTDAPAEEAPAKAAPAKPTRDPFRAERRRGSFDGFVLPDLEVRGLVLVEGREATALLGIADRAQVVAAGETLTLSVRATGGAAGERRIALKVTRVDRGGVSLLHAETGKKIELR